MSEFKPKFNDMDIRYAKEWVDHFEIEAGSAAKGIKVSLKTYYNALEIDEAQKKIENTLKIRQYLMDKGIIQ